MDFEGFGKIPRLFRGCVITEKLDGTNAQVNIVRGFSSDCDYQEDNFDPRYVFEINNGDDTSHFIYAGSRNRYVTRENDNYGFAQWVHDNAAELLKLGEGRHFGEWWGQGIQRGYGLKEKRFSLFNVHRWADDAVRPASCHVVPVLYQGPFDTCLVMDSLEKLRQAGSVAVPGWMKPEGVIVYHTAADSMFKVTCEKDEAPKGK